MRVKLYATTSQHKHPVYARKGAHHHSANPAHSKLFSSIEALLEATRGFFDRYNRTNDGMRSIISASSITQKLCSCT